MRELKLVRMFGALVLLASAPVLGAVAAYAQKSPTESTSPGAPAPGTPKGALDSPSAPGSGATETPSAPAKKPGDTGVTPMTPSMTTPPAGGAGKGAALDAKPVPGLGVLTADGQKVGEVTAVKASADGKVESIQVKTGGMLGFGGRTVNIPPAKFTVAGQNVQLSMTSAEVSKLPAVEAPQG